MNANEYQTAALRTANPKCRDILNCAVGLTGEAGEFADAIKKEFFQGHTRNRDALINELGDVAWYLAVAAHVLGVDLEAVLQANVVKLNARYPDGFDPERSINRSDAQSVPKRPR